MSVIYIQEWTWKGSWSDQKPAGYRVYTSPRSCETHTRQILRQMETKGDDAPLAPEGSPYPLDVDSEIYWKVMGGEGVKGKGPRPVDGKVELEE